MDCDFTHKAALLFSRYRAALKANLILLGRLSMVRPKYVIVDIDGTIADVRHRLHHIQSPGKKDWPAFFAEMDHDEPIVNMIEYVQKLASDHSILIVSGRPARYRAQTERWLKKYTIPYERLFLRRNGDHRPDYEAKAEVLKEIPARQIALAIDDRPPVCDRWEKNGIRCMRVQSDVENQEVNEVYRAGQPKASSQKAALTRK